MNSIFDSHLSTPEGVELFGERKFVACMLRYEAALARAQASGGLIPESAAQSIIGTCKVELFDVAKIVRESARAGTAAVPLVKSLTETVGLFNPDAAKFVHYGATHQDVIDTAMALVTREALGLIESDVRLAIIALLSQAEHHAGASVLVRGMMRPTSVTSFGFVCTTWSAPLVRSLRRLQSTAAPALCVRLGSAAAGLAQMTSVTSQVQAHMAAELELGVPAPGWHGQRDEWTVLGCELAVLLGSLGSIATDITVRSQFEIAELAEPTDTSPLRQLAPAASRPPQALRTTDPVACMLTLSAARRAPQRVAALLAAMTKDHQGAPGIEGSEAIAGIGQAQFAEWPGLLMSAHGATRAMARALQGLQVDAKRMHANFETVRGAAANDRASVAFAPALVEQAAILTLAQVAAQRASLAAINATVPAI